MIRRGQVCACGCGQLAHDMHHAIFSRIKKYPELNDEKNLVPVNHLEHIARKFDNVKWRRFFWSYQVDKYGEKAMFEWLNNLPTKLDGRVKELKCILDN
jgi:hypothetical protein